MATAIVVSIFFVFFGQTHTVCVWPENGQFSEFLYTAFSALNAMRIRAIRCSAAVLEAAARNLKHLYAF